MKTEPIIATGYLGFMLILAACFLVVLAIKPVRYRVLDWMQTEEYYAPEKTALGMIALALIGWAFYVLM